MSQTATLTPAAVAAASAVATARARIGSRADAADPEGVRLRAGLAMASAMAVGAAELDDLHVDPNEIEGRMLNAMASALVTLLSTLAQGDAALAEANLPSAMSILFMEAKRQVRGDDHVTVEVAAAGPMGRA